MCARGVLYLRGGVCAYFQGGWERGYCRRYTVPYQIKSFHSIVSTEIRLIWLHVQLLFGA